VPFIDVTLQGLFHAGMGIIPKSSTVCAKTFAPLMKSRSVSFLFLNLVLFVCYLTSLLNASPEWQ
jgi:hypothetical protein